MNVAWGRYGAIPLVPLAVAGGAAGAGVGSALLKRGKALPGTIAQQHAALQAAGASQQRMLQGKTTQQLLAGVGILFGGGLALAAILLAAKAQRTKK